MCSRARCGRDNELAKAIKLDEPPIAVSRGSVFVRARKEGDGLVSLSSWRGLQRRRALTFLIRSGVGQSHDSRPPPLSGFGGCS